MTSTPGHHRPAQAGEGQLAAGCRCLSRGTATWTLFMSRCGSPRSRQPGTRARQATRTRAGKSSWVTSTRAPWPLRPQAMTKRAGCWFLPQSRDPGQLRPAQASHGQPTDRNVVRQLFDSCSTDVRLTSPASLPKCCSTPVRQLFDSCSTVQQGQPWPAMASSGQPRPAMASHSQPTDRNVVRLSFD